MLLVIALGAAACGGEEESASAGSRELVDRLPRLEPAGVIYVDVDAARAALGLGPAVDPESVLEGSDAERRFVLVAAAAVPYIGSPVDTAVRKAIDATQIRAAANNFLTVGEESVSVLATDQPFDEIAATLEDEGFTRDGEVLTSGESPQAVGATAVAGGEGIVALGFTPEAVEAAAAGEAEPADGPERDLLASLDAPAVAAFATSDGCSEAIGAADALTDGEGELVVAASEPDAARFVFDDSEDFLVQDLRFGEPSVDGDLVRAPVTVPLDSISTGLLGILRGDLPTGTIYDC